MEQRTLVLWSCYFYAVLRKFHKLHHEEIEHHLIVITEGRFRKTSEWRLKMDVNSAFLKF